MVDHYGNYMNHLLALVEDATVTSDEKARYIQKWQHPRMLVCKPCTLMFGNAPLFLAKFYKMRILILFVVSEISSRLANTAVCVKEQDPQQCMVYCKACYYQNQERSYSSRSCSDRIQSCDVVLIDDVI